MPSALGKQQMEMPLVSKHNENTVLSDQLSTAVPSSPQDPTTLRGRRPQFTDDAMLDRLYSITLALVSELAVTRCRVDTLERLLKAKGSLSATEMEDFVADDAAQLERGQLQQQMLQRIFREIDS
jgi:hypothetical protein